MKDSAKLQRKLLNCLKNHSNLHVAFKPPCSEEDFREVAWVVQDYVYHSGDVTNDDPLYEWVEEYQFYVTETQVR